MKIASLDILRILHLQTVLLPKCILSGASCLCQNHDFTGTVISAILQSWLWQFLSLSGILDGITVLYFNFSLVYYLYSLSTQLALAYLRRHS